MKKTVRRCRVVVLLSSGLLLVVHAAVFLRFFPNARQGLGHDFGYFFPALLDGYFWFKSNGIGEVPWFSPAACGGVPVLPNPLRGYYTVSQFWAFLFDPLDAVRLTLVFFAGVGLWGAYRLLRRSFGLSEETALYGAGVFLFNGFFAHRMLIGHLGYCHFMLLPLIASLLIEPVAARDGGSRRPLMTGCLLAGCLLAAAVQSEFVTTMVPALFALVLIGSIHGFIHGRATAFFLRLTTAGFFGVLLSLARLSSMAYLLDNFPRNAYPLPGAEGWLAAAGLIIRSLAVSPAYDPSRLTAFTNTRFSLDRHEWEYDLTPVPFLVLVIGAAVIGLRRRDEPPGGRPAAGRWALMVPVVLLLLLPVALNSYYPGWNAFLKQLPLIGSSSSLIRWVIVYIPFVVLVSALILERAVPRRRTRALVVFGSLTVVLLCNGLVDRQYYHDEWYDPAPVTRAWHRLSHGSQAPAIDKLLIYRNQDGVPILPAFRNDTIVQGGSQLLCYEPMFGYRLEYFPVRSLRPGPVMKVRDGVYNLKNPACYIWPVSNRCRPGDHFAEGEASSARAFAAYQPFAFEVPWPQSVANWINALALVLAGLYFLVRGVLRSRTGN